jgi:hypothetical protein
MSVRLDEPEPMDASRRTPASDPAAVLARLRSLPQVRLQATTDAVTSIVFRATTIAMIDRDRQTAEIPAPPPQAQLAEDGDVQRGPMGLTVHLTSASRGDTAVDLIRGSLDAALYRWQLDASSP